MISEFFNSWRRKAGCVTLVMALVFTAGWVRSRIQADLFHFSSGRFTRESFVSFRENLIWNRFRHFDNGIAPDVIVERGENLSKFIVANQMSNYEGFAWQVSWNTFGICRRDVALAEYTMTAFTIPYWLIAIPFTGLSAILLLWPAKQVKLGDTATTCDI